MDKIPVGYKAICQKFNLTVLPHYCISYITLQGRGKTIIENHEEIHIYPKTYALKDPQDMLENLEFSLKYEGINLAIIEGLFQHIEKSYVLAYIQRQPTGVHSRKIWFLYEFLMMEHLDLSDCQRLKYIDLLDSKKYYTGSIIKSPRHAINNNLLGYHQFCPFVRRTNVLENYIAEQLDVQAKSIINKYDPALITRACNYLYTKETMSSYQIEREQPDQRRLTRFIHMLQEAPRIESLTKEKLIELQNIIVDPRFKDVDYRHTQNYVGENITPYYQKIHYISPKPSDVPELMQGLLSAMEQMLASPINPVIIAAVVSFGFVFIHPFEDGNGRLHRFLIHYILSKKEFTPKEAIFPISAIMLKNINLYDATLESFSKPLLEVLTEYYLSNEGVLDVKQESRSLYQYYDFTSICEYLFLCVEKAVHNYLEPEIEFLLNYDKTKRAIQKIIDMPDNLIDLIIKFVMQNNGKLAPKKQKKYFSLLTADEIEEIIDLINTTMMKNAREEV